MSDLLCSVIICTHNPRRDYLNRVLDGINKQTMPRNSFELILIDNLSAPETLKGIDLSWHPAHKIVVEKELGLTAARLRGFMETSSDIIVFCDDDNVLDKDYLGKAVEIAENYPFLGAWGGSCEGEYESPLPKWARNGFFRSIGVRRIEKICWSNLLNHCCPVGAGMVLRRAVANAYIDKIETSQIRKKLGRQGASLMSGEDIDLVNTSCEIGLGTGLFPSLTLKHLIPRERLTIEYYEKLAEGIATSMTILRCIQGEKVNTKQYSSIFCKLKDGVKELYLRSRISSEDFRIYKARKRGERKALAFFE